jgi:hypothetical protein
LSMSMSVVMVLLLSSVGGSTGASGGPSTLPQRFLVLARPVRPLPSPAPGKKKPAPGIVALLLPSTYSRIY